MAAPARTAVDFFLEIKSNQGDKCSFVKNCAFILGISVSERRHESVENKNSRNSSFFMKTHMRNLLVALALLALSTLNLQLSTCLAQGTAFTYQGRLNSSGGPANGLYDFRFRLDADPAGNTILATVLTNAIGVTNGLFTTTMDFGAGWFNGGNYWLEVDVKTNNFAAYTALNPFQQITPTPYAVFASTAGNVSGTVSAAQISGAVSSANVSGTYGNAVTLNNAGNSFTGNGAGLTSLNASQLTTGTLVDARLSTNVALLNANQTFTGTNSFSNNISMLDPTKSIIFPATSGVNSPMMYMFASETANADRMVIAHSPNYPNWGLQYQDAADPVSYLSGGTPVMSVDLARQRVGIGTTNPAASLDVNGDVWVSNNLSSASLNVSDNVGIGINNPTDAALSVAGRVRMNDNNIYFRSGTDTNHGIGYYYGSKSFAGNSTIDGPVLFGYNSGVLGTEQFGTEHISLQWDSSSVSVYGTFNNNSDRNAKQHFTTVTASQILGKVAQLPVSEWSYKVDGATRHIGPMAQDFYSIFNVGTDDKHIAPIDEGGVALAAIQGLNQKLNEKDGEIQTLKQQNDSLAERLNELEVAVKQLTAQN